MSYSADLVENNRRAAAFVDKTNRVNDAQGAGKFVSNFLLISIAFSPVKPSPAASSAIALK